MATYLKNKDLLAEVIRAKGICALRGDKVMTDELAVMFMLMCEKFGGSGRYGGYTYIEDMEAFALMQLVKTWSAFDIEKYNNPFAFYTQCIKFSFWQYLKKEKKHRDIRDLLWIGAGLDPSHGYVEPEVEED